LDVRDPRTGRCTAIGEVKTILEEANKQLETIEGVLPDVHGEYYRVSSKYLRDVGDYNGYYREALRYLGCVNVEQVMSSKYRLFTIFMSDMFILSVSDSERVFQAKCLGLAALLGDEVYNIGELVSFLKFLKYLSEPTKNRNFHFSSLTRF
jgi:26S proteasome regulatory subunit N9